MANKNDIFPENIPGLFYVDQDCISCDTCTQIAGDFFKLTDDNDHAYVYQQPKSDYALLVCKRAMEECPVNSIGCNGASK